MVISPTITKLPYDPLKDFAPIGLAVRLQNIFVTHPRVAAHTIPELITLMRQTPNLNYASSGLGSPGHLAGALFQTMTKTELNHIPYKGGGLALADLAGGQIPLFIAVISTSLPLVKAGKVNAIAVTGPKRTPVLPEIPWKPVAPNAPVLPETPVAPSAPAVPCGPELPEIPWGPVAPSTPDAPWCPTTPFKLTTHAVYVPDPMVAVLLNNNKPVIGSYNKTLAY